MFALGWSQTKMIYMQSVGVLCQNAHTTTACLAGAPHSLKMLWDTEVKLHMGCTSHDGSYVWGSCEAHGCSTASSFPTSCSGSASFLQNLALLSDLLLIPAFPVQTHHVQEVHFQTGCSACELWLLHSWKRHYQEQLSFTLYTCRDIYPHIRIEETAPPPLWD